MREGRVWVCSFWSYHWLYLDRSCCSSPFFETFFIYLLFVSPPRDHTRYRVTRVTDRAQKVCRLRACLRARRDADTWWDSAASSPPGPRLPERRQDRYRMRRECQVPGRRGLSRPTEGCSFVASECISVRLLFGVRSLLQTVESKRYGTESLSRVWFRCYILLQ